jgi:diaminopimelate decarboxylase
MAGTGSHGGGAMGTAVPAAINRALARHFPSPRTRVIGEPGRYMVQDAATVACAINGVRPRHTLVRVRACMLQAHGATWRQHRNPSMVIADCGGYRWGCCLRS